VRLLGGNERDFYRDKLRERDAQLAAERATSASLRELLVRTENMITTLEDDVAKGWQGLQEDIGAALDAKP
jgi:hypothetical protein